MAKKQVYEGDDGKKYTVQEKKPFYKKWWFWILALVIIFAIYSAGKGDKATTTNNATSQNTAVTDTKDEAADAPAEENKDYELSEVTVEEENGVKHVVGVLKNNTDKEKSFIQISFPYKDADGNKLGTASAAVNDLGPGETWKFKAVVLDTTTEGIQVDTENPEISGF